MIRLNDGQYWLCAAVDSESNESLHTQLESARTNVIASSFVEELREKHDVENAVFLVDGDEALNYACQRHGLNFRYERHGNQNSIRYVFREVKRRSSSFPNNFSNAHAETANQ